MPLENSHPLDAAIWWALTTRQAPLAQGAGAARRMRADIGPFAAMADALPAAAAALEALMESGDDVSLLQPDAPLPPFGLTQHARSDAVQMIAPAITQGGVRTPAFEVLTEADAADMLALATLTRPGPFRARTHTLGRFIGIRDAGRLIAMAGERLKPEGFVEVSGVCTHPEYRGRGYAGALMRAVADRILSDGETPFLHAYASNTGAIALYETLGFKHRANVVHAVWTKP